MNGKRVSATPDILLQQQFEHPEGIVWDARRQRLLWLDIFKGHVLSFDLKSRALQTLQVGKVVGSVAPRRAGGLVCAVREGFGFLAEDETFTFVSTHLRDTPYAQMNDGGVDPRGRFWAGSMTFEFQTRPNACALYRLDPDGTISTQLPGVSIGNGIAWSPEGKRCYYVDSATHRIDDFEFDVEGGFLGKRRVLAEVDAFPDGIAVDTDGCIWVALFQGWEVRRFTPAGKVDRVIRMPGSQVTTCTFGGSDLRTLFIAVSPHNMSEETKAREKTGYIFALDVGVQGLSTPEYLG